MQVSAPKNLLVNLQICRGVAAAMVVVAHALQDSESIAARLGLNMLRSDLNWACGVDIFFVISGFIMVHVAAGEFGKPGAALQFLKKRIARIVPLYWLLTSALIVGSVVAPALLNVPIGDVWHIVSSYFFIPDSRPDKALMRPVLALGWTLNYEMFFYVFFAASMFFQLNRGIALLTSVFVAAVALRSLLHVGHPLISFWTDPLLLEFLFGVYISILWRTGLRISGKFAVVLAVFGMALVTGLLPDPFGLGEEFNFIRHGVPAAMIISAATLGPGLASSLPVRFGASLGDASYALYLCHPFVIRPLREVWIKLGGGALPLMAYVAFCVIAAVGVSMAIHRFVELPIGRTITNLGKKRSRAHAAFSLASTRSAKSIG